jgi:hypothetical protein
LDFSTEEELQKTASLSYSPLFYSTVTLEATLKNCVLGDMILSQALKPKKPFEKSIFVGARHASPLRERPPFQMTSNAPSEGML